MNQEGTPQKASMLSGFGFVTPEDRMKWDQARSQLRKKNPSAAKEMVSSLFAGVSEIAQQGMQAQMRAAHQVHMQEQREGSRVEKVNTITQTVDFHDRDMRPTLDDELDF